MSNLESPGGGTPLFKTRPGHSRFLSLVADANGAGGTQLASAGTAPTRFLVRLHRTPDRAARLRTRSPLYVLSAISFNTALRCGHAPPDRLTSYRLAYAGRRRVPRRHARRDDSENADGARDGPRSCRGFPNPARNRVVVKLPREDKSEMVPPTAEQVLSVYRLLPPRYRLPLLVLDATGMRLGEIDGLRWGDVDESRTRWRVSKAVSKTNSARWVGVSPVLFESIMALCPRDDRTPDRQVFQGFGGDRFRTAITRACTAAGVPTFSPHDLRHRRISLLHLGGVPWARIGEHVGQRNQPPRRVDDDRRSRRSGDARVWLGRPGPE